MKEIQTIYINPLLRRLIAERYSKHFKIGVKRALGIVLAFIDPRMDSASSYNKRGVWMDRVAIEAPRLLISRIQRQPGMIEKAGGERPTPAVVYNILLDAMDEYNNILKTEISHQNVTYFRRHLDGRIEFITPNGKVYEFTSDVRTVVQRRLGYPGISFIARDEDTNSQESLITSYDIARESGVTPDGEALLKQMAETTTYYMRDYVSYDIAELVEMVNKKFPK